jgi:hypothetical protein
MGDPEQNTTTVRKLLLAFNSTKGIYWVVKCRFNRR